MIKRKILIVIMSLVILFTSFVVPQRQAEAAAATIAVGGVAVSATALYVLGAMAVGGLATAVGLSYGDDINRHAKDLWDSASDTVKSGFADALSASQNGYVKLSGATKSWFDSATNSITSKFLTASSATVDKTLEKDTTNTTQVYPTGGSSNISLFNKTFSLPSGYTYVAVVNGEMVKAASVKITMNERGSTTVHFDISNRLVASLNLRDAYGLNFANAALNSFRNITNFGDMTNIFKNVFGLNAAVLSDATLNSYYNSILANTNTIYGTGSLGLRLPHDDLYLPKSVTGQTLTRVPDGLVLPDGTIYTGDVTYKLPDITILDINGVKVPGIPLADYPGQYVNVNTGEIIITSDVDVPVDGVIPGEVIPKPKETEIGGLFSKLWDWLKKILDAILSLPAKLIELLGTLLSTLLSALFVPSDTFWSDNFNQIKLLLQEKLDTESYTSVLNDIKNITSPTFSDVKIPAFMGSGRDMVIIKASYINNYLPTIHNWIKGLFFVLLVFYNLNNVYKLLRGGDITSAIQRRSGKD